MTRVLVFIIGALRVPAAIVAFYVILAAVYQRVGNFEQAFALTALLAFVGFISYIAGRSALDKYDRHGR